MAPTLLRVSVLLTFILCYTDGYMQYMVGHCVFNSTNPNDIEFIYSKFYNGLEYVQFSSSLGKFVGYTEYGVKQAAYFNNQSSYMSIMRTAKSTYCQHNIEIWYSNILPKSAKPSARLHSEAPPAAGHPAMLVCTVYDFYPKQIKVSWLRNGKEITSGVTSTEEMADGDWYYQIHSHLEYTPQSGEKISCKVDHRSLSEPLMVDWDPSMPESERNKIAIGASGLILGLVLSLAGFIYYKSKTRRRTLVPTTD